MGGRCLLKKVSGPLLSRDHPTDNRTAARKYPVMSEAIGNAEEIASYAMVMEASVYA